MNRIRSLVLCAVVLGVWPSAALAQGFAASTHAGTLGLGADVSFAFTRQFAVRAGLNVQPWEPAYVFEDVEFTLSLASPTYLGMLDWHPGGGAFRLSAGAMVHGRDHAIRARLTQPMDVGGQTYQPEDIGTLTGLFQTRQVSPYAGLGMGRVGGNRGVGLALDVGLAFHGEPAVRLSATGPIASNATFQSNLAQEERNMEEDVRSLRIFPVLSLGLTIGF